MTEPGAPLASPFAHRGYALYWGGRIVSILSFQMLMVAIGWQLYSLTGSALDLGFLGLAQFVPMVALTLVVGHVVDRFEHRVILLACQLVEATAAIALALGTAMGWLDPIAIYAITALVGAARAFEIPTMVAIIPGLVPRVLVPAATALFTTANQAGTIVGPVLGGLLYALGPSTVYVSAIGLWCIGATFIFAMRTETIARSSGPVSLSSLFGGFQFVRRDRVILGTIALDMCAVFLAGAGALFPVFARDILETGPWGLGLLRAAPAAGAVAMSLLIARRPLRVPVGHALYGVVAIFGAATVVFALSTHLLLSLAALVVLGGADAVSVVIRFSLIQLRTPAEMRGRVSSVNGLFTGTSNYLGDFRAGAAASMIGAVPAVLIGGAGVFLVLALWLFLFPQLRRIRSLDEGPEPARDKDRPPP